MSVQVESPGSSRCLVSCFDCFLYKEEESLYRIDQTRISGISSTMKPKMFVGSAIPPSCSTDFGEIPSCLEFNLPLSLDVLLYS